MPVTAKWIKIPNSKSILEYTNDSTCANMANLYKSLPNTLKHYWYVELPAFILKQQTYEYNEIKSVYDWNFT